MRKPIIEFNDFSFQYYSQQEPTLHHINVTLYEGEKVLIVGPSGSGKSTLANCLNGLIPFAYKGEITGSLKIHGKETKDQDIFTLSKMVGTVLQDSDGQFVGLSVGEDIAFSLENDNVPVDQMKQRVKKISQMVDMDNHLMNSPFELSGGQKQRVSLAGVMVDDVGILLFDEPLANLDPATGKTAIELIDEIQKQSNKTIVIIEHRLEDVLHRHVDRILVVNDGRIIMDGTPNEVLASNILVEQGIREPLYVTALKYAQVPIEEKMHPEHIDTIDISGYEPKVQNWFHSVEKPVKQQDEKVILDIQNLSFSYDGVRPILKDVSFQVHEGEMLSIVGRNGAGKSTLSKILVGFEKEDSGHILVDGVDIANKTIKERAEIIGIVMQNPNQMISKTMIYDEIALGLVIRGVEKDEIERRVDHIMKICGLAPFKNWPISALSYGQKKRVTIAAILVLNPKILILDEPTAGQDYHHYSEIMEFLRSLNEQGQTIIMITHDMHLMLEYTPRTVVISDGEKIANDSSAKILTNHEVIEKANLKETSLYHLAHLANIDEADEFVQRFIDYEKEVKAHEN
ncbi:MAG: ABC transporter ATP-binding protein [Erysipelotrichaceae bacterium]|nr:ABC transporter ATP-binding protein [Erysipelotrichaceae bacterium]